MEWSGYIQKLRGSLGKVWLASAFILVSLLSFEAGSIRQALLEPKPVVIEVPDRFPAESLPKPQGTPETTVKSVPVSSLESTEGCTFVGSKNSNKYHAPASRCAKQIKTENRVCFASVDAATRRGYIPGCLE